MTGWAARLCPAAPGLAIGIAVLCLLFLPEIASALHVWSTSTAYGHCFLILPIAAWLLWERRGRIAAAPLAPTPRLALLALPFAALWFAADMIGVMEGRQLAFIGLVEIVLLAALGASMFLSLSVAALYLIFLVPFGAFLTPSLQNFTAGFVAHGLDLLGIPSRVTDMTIEIPDGTFYVAQACAGLRFLIASVAFGVLYAVTMFRSPWRRAAFILISCIVPVIANGFRALGIVVMGDILGSAQAAAADHLIYGWVFFSIVIVCLALAGLPFRQDGRADPARPSPIAATAEAGRQAVLAAIAVLAVAGAVRLGAAAMDSAGAVSDPSPLVIAPESCRAEPVLAHGATLNQAFTCASRTGSWHFTEHVQALPQGANPARAVEAVQSTANALLDGPDVDSVQLSVPSGVPAHWNMLIDRGARRAVAYLLFVNGHPTLGGLSDRIAMARALLFGKTYRPLAVLVEAQGEGAEAVDDALRWFLHEQGDLPARAGARALARR